MTGVLKVQTAPGVWEQTNGGVTHEYMDNAHWNTAWGHVANFSRLGSASISIAALANLCNALSFTFQSGRRYRLVCYVRAFSGMTATGAISLSLYDGAVSLVGTYGGSAHSYVVNAGNYGNINAEWLIDGTGQTHTALAFKASGPTGCIAHVEPNSQFYIEDVGPITRLPEGVLPSAPDWTSFDARFVNVNGDGMTGDLLTTKVLLSTAQGNEINAVTRKDYVDLLANDVTPLSRTWASVAGAGSTITVNDGWAYWIPVVCPACSIDGLGIDVTTAGAAGSVTRLGIYGNHATRIEPYALVKDAGTVATATTGWKSITFASVAWPGGWMWLTMLPQGAPATGPQFRSVTGHGEPWVLFAVDQVPPGLSYRGWTQAIGAGALPATATPGLSAGNNPKVAFHVP